MVDVDTTVDVVDLMLKTLRQEIILSADTNFPTGDVLRLRQDPRRSCHSSAIAGHAQTAFDQLSLAAAFDHLGIDHHKGPFARHTDHDDAQPDANLRRGDTDAVRGVHGVDHVGHQRP